MAAGQLTKDCSHSFHCLLECWISFQAAISTDDFSLEPLLVVYTWAFQTAAHSQCTGVDISLCGPWAYPRAGPTSPLPPLLPIANVNSFIRLTSVFPLPPIWCIKTLINSRMMNMLSFLPSHVAEFGLHAPRPVFIWLAFWLNKNLLWKRLQSCSYFFVCLSV